MARDKLYYTQNDFSNKGNMQNSFYSNFSLRNIFPSGRSNDPKYDKEAKTKFEVKDIIDIKDINKIIDLRKEKDIEEDIIAPNTSIKTFRDMDKLEKITYLSNLSPLTDDVICDYITSNRLYRGIFESFDGSTVTISYKNIKQNININELIDIQFYLPEYKKN